ncbi:hypothetical protein [Mycolicibacterium holsaticum]|jgi:hypothetical protein|uniref:Uncharacterized protein n=1 Tax=Mycolicibacterium holsaticum TaxID=152142 RepID=A0A1E3RVF6_9MYCO|nr:hypothetical protein [Mycolicibacterium holsaticum]MDA4105780.1 hypothetical protein [Mycolicibacterium holsaticum DSM 44478 = JCM 12374]ODQ93811.1 hypothetical protein BHQ17_11840 [Mycolicibacterium holsaticum]QZA13855.1 hypothetical protein K3U96_06910 [Mycolicibacterium holsaticum DSM 44478 = JCM 12374]UNC08685.1 hypothetical protein H5U41_19925 [Mycolicibacterium holsaticum DSM 44478 = JCM 12374]
MTEPTKEPAAASVDDEHRWADLDPLVKFGVVLAALLFTGVIIEGASLVPYALIQNGWTPGR